MIQTKEFETNPYLVWDENSNSFKPFNAPGVKPKLEGEFSVDGIKVKTVFTALKENQKQYTLKWAANKTEIEENIIFELAKRLCYTWSGSSRVGIWRCR